MIEWLREKILDRKKTETKREMAPVYDEVDSQFERIHVAMKACAMRLANMEEPEDDEHIQGMEAGPGAGAGAIA